MDTQAPLRIGVVTGSTRPHRMGPGVAEWVVARAEARPDLTPVPLDLVDFDLPLFDEDRPPALGPGDRAHTLGIALMSLERTSTTSPDRSPLT